MHRPAGGYFCQKKLATNDPAKPAAAPVAAPTAAFSMTSSPRIAAAVALPAAPAAAPTARFRPALSQAPKATRPVKATPISPARRDRTPLLKRITLHSVIVSVLTACREIRRRRPAPALRWRARRGVAGWPLPSQETHPVGIRATGPRARRRTGPRQGIL